MSKEQAVVDWVSSNPLLKDRVLLDFLSGSEGNCSISPVAGPAQDKIYVDGSKGMHYDFAFQIMLRISSSDDQANIENMDMMRRFQDWVEEQQYLKNFPNFGERAYGYRIENLGNTPQLAMVFENNMARYQFFVRINYIEEPIKF